MRERHRNTLRLDKIIGMITIITMIIFAGIIYMDFRPAGDSSETLNQETEQGEEGTQSENLNKKVTVCIDAGHGGSDAGAGSGVYEKTQTLAVALRVQKYLQDQDVQVVMTRTTDTDVSNEQRVQISNASKAVALVSIHRNYYEGTEDVYGAEAWIHSAGPAEAKKLANSILTKLNKEVRENNRGVKLGSMDGDGDYYMNAHSQSTSCILELGFITSRLDDALVTTEIEETSKAIADGIIEFLKTMGYMNG